MERQPDENDPEIDLHTASSLGDIAIVKNLLSRKKIKKYVSKKNEKGWTPLMYACFHHHKSMVEFLVSQSADKNTLNKNKQSAFMIAASHDDTKILQQVYVKDYINSVDIDGNSPLYYAVLYGCNKSVKWLLKRNANPDHVEKDSGDTLIMVAVKNGKQDIVRSLLKYKPNLEIKNNNGETPVSLAAKLGCYDTAMLIQAHKGGNNLQKVLENLSLEKYWPLMEKNKIDLSKFLKMNEDDLKEIGITLLGPRRKMAVIISQINTELMHSINIYIENE